jgi:hypothetical protein
VLTTRHPPTEKVGNNFADKRRSPCLYSSLADSGHGFFFLSFYNAICTFTFTGYFWLNRHIVPVSLQIHDILRLHKDIIRYLLGYVYTVMPVMPVSLKVNYFEKRQVGYCRI